MTVDTLHEHQDVAILRLLENAECTQEEVAQMFGVTRWYVRKLVMASKQGVQPLSQSDQELLQVARATGLNAEQLQLVLALKPLTGKNIYEWLVDQPLERLSRLMFQIILTQEAKKQSQGQTNATPPQVG
jgi:predicted XRE-type DNA-binding protein